MTFENYMNGLSAKVTSEKGRMVQKITEACLVSEVVVYNWIAGRSTPDALKRKTISGLLGIPEGELFPNVRK